MPSHNPSRGGKTPSGKSNRPTSPMGDVEETGDVNASREHGPPSTASSVLDSQATGIAQQALQQRRQGLPRREASDDANRPSSNSAGNLARPLYVDSGRFEPVRTNNRHLANWVWERRLSHREGFAVLDSIISNSKRPITLEAAIEHWVRVLPEELAKRRREAEWEIALLGADSVYVLEAKVSYDSHGHGTVKFRDREAAEAISTNCQLCGRYFGIRTHPNDRDPKVVPVKLRCCNCFNFCLSCVVAVISHRRACPLVALDFADCSWRVRDDPFLGWTQRCKALVQKVESLVAKAHTREGRDYTRFTETSELARELPEAIYSLRLLYYSLKEGLGFKARSHILTSSCYLKYESNMILCMELLMLLQHTCGVRSYTEDYDPNWMRTLALTSRVEVFGHTPFDRPMDLLAPRGLSRTMQNGLMRSLEERRPARDADITFPGFSRVREEVVRLWRRPIRAFDHDLFPSRIYYRAMTALDRLLPVFVQLYHDMPVDGIENWLHRTKPDSLKPEMRIWIVRLKLWVLDITVKHFLDTLYPIEAIEHKTQSTSNGWRKRDPPGRGGSFRMRTGRR